MVIWSGFGFLVAVIVFACALLFNFIFDAAWGSEYYSSHYWTIGVAMLVAAAATWLLSDRLGRQEPRVLVDKQTGQDVVLRSSHTLFFVPIQYWAYILAAIGLGLLVAEVAT